MTDRPRLDQLTDDQLDQLYADLDTLEAVCDSNKRAYVGAVKDAMAADERAGRAEQLAADLRTQVITQQKRAEKAEAELAVSREVARSNRRHIQTIVPELEKAEAAIARVRALHVRNGHTGDCEHCSASDYPNYAVADPCPTLRALDGTT